MKKYILAFLLVSLMFSCKNESKQVAETKENEIASTEHQELAYSSFGMEISPSDALTAKRMATHYEKMTVGDSIDAKMIAKVDEVCQAKGCWMKVDLENGEQVMVKFKDYGFFMPKDIAGREVVMNGKAYVNEVSVDEQRHYAEDAGQSEEEIAKITEPKKTYSFLADGVLIKE